VQSILFSKYAEGLMQPESQARKQGYGQKDAQGHKPYFFIIDFVQI